jgi:hypothetical protein
MSFVTRWQCIAAGSLPAETTVSSCNCLQSDQHMQHKFCWKLSAVRNSPQESTYFACGSVISHSELNEHCERHDGEQNGSSKRKKEKTMLTMDWTSTILWLPVVASFYPSPLGSLIRNLLVEQTL